MVTQLGSACLRNILVSSETHSRNRRRGNVRPPGRPDTEARLESRYDDSGNRQAPDCQEGQMCVEPLDIHKQADALPESEIG